MEKRNVLCYSKYSFDKIMESNGWTDRPGERASVISICSLNEGEDGVHWFSESGERVFNLDIDDCGPFWFRNHEECYDTALELYNSDKKAESDAYFSDVYISGPQECFCSLLCVLNYSDAFSLVRFIDDALHRGDTLYIHCAVGASRSQGIVRYILDTYSGEYEIVTNPDNPCLTPNAHVTMMLKRAYRQLFNPFIGDSYFEHKKGNVDDVPFDIKLGKI